MTRVWVGAAAALMLVTVGAAMAGVVWLPLALAILVAVGAALIRRPQRGLLLVAALTPYNGLLLISHLPTAATYWKELVVLATMGAGLLSPQETRADPGRKLPGWAPAVGGWLVVGLVSAVGVGLIQAYTGYRIDFFYVLLAVAIWRNPLRGRDLDRLVSILMLNGVITSLVGILQQVLGAGRLNSLGYQYNSVIRFSGSHLRSFSTFNQPFPFGLYVMIVLLVGVPVALSDRSRLRNRLFLACLPILGVGILTSLVRAAWLGLGVGIVFLGLRRHRILLSVIPLALVALLYVPGSLTNTALSSSSFQDRTNTWSQNFDHVLVHPLGEGIGSTGSAAAKTAALTAVATGSPTLQPDNYYFSTLYELGVPGLYFLVLLLLAAILETDRAARRTIGLESEVCLGITASFLAAAVAMTVATYLQIYPMDLTFWMFLGISATYSVRQADAPVGQRSLADRLRPATTRS
ncbi:MAG TPA: O-antigen ligase family protein [Acidimicrobiales bacterium]|nr:O-antigen ligase family protein [Acidimicrobiales bacterium]